MKRSKVSIELLRRMRAIQKRLQFQENLRWSFLWFTLGGLTLISSSSLFEILYGQNHTHPIWDESFNWLPLIIQIIAVAAISSWGLAYVSVYTRLSTLEDLEVLLAQVFSRLRRPSAAGPGHWVSLYIIRIKNVIRTTGSALFSSWTLRARKYLGG